MRTITTRAWAKINLGLFVTGRRDDGYHDILTVFHRVNLSDELIIEDASDIVVESDAADVPSGPANICHKAAALVREAAGVTRGVRIRIAKQIPAGAGLGGGSADAGAVLDQLPDFWGVQLTGGVRQNLALRLGSDVPYFLGHGPAVASGRGEILEYFDLDIPFTILLCSPGVHVSTAWAYGQVRPRPRSSPSELKALVIEGLRSPARLRKELVNDFEPAVFAAHPVVRTVKEAMVSAGAVFASMSGSGSSVYGFFRDPAAARVLSERFEQQGYRCSTTPPHFKT